MKTYLFGLVLLCLAFRTGAQSDSAMIRRTPADTSKSKMNMDAIYNRPFLQAGKLPVTVGGYLEANTSYFVTNGVTDGFSFQIPRMTLFISSSIKKRLKFLTEIEFEDGGRHVSLEFASLDVELHPLLNFRGGIVMNPIGAFNQNHDGPRWEFVSRPLSATTIIPSTWSNVGFGLFGKYGKGQFIWAYEAYLTNGFDDQIIANTENRTWLPASKENPDRFEESFNGVPLVTTKVAIKHRKVGELGLSWMGGVYNRFQVDGITLDQRRRVDLFAIDANVTFPGSNTYLIGEFVWSFVNVPDTYSQQFGNKQEGGFVDIVQPVIKRNILGWQNAVINVACRTEYVDYNKGTFKETGGIISDHIFAISPGVSLRPSAQTVFRLNYTYQKQVDILGNPAAHTAGIQFGFSSYF